MRKRRLRGLRARLVVAFGLGVAVAAISTGALTFREGAPAYSSRARTSPSDN